MERTEGARRGGPEGLPETRSQACREGWVPERPGQDHLHALPGPTPSSATESAASVGRRTTLPCAATPQSPRRSQAASRLPDELPLALHLRGSSGWIREKGSDETSRAPGAAPPLPPAPARTPAAARGSGTRAPPPEPSLRAPQPDSRPPPASSRLIPALRAPLLLPSLLPPRTETPAAGSSFFPSLPDSPLPPHPQAPVAPSEGPVPALQANFLGLPISDHGARVRPQPRGLRERARGAREAGVLGWGLGRQGGLGWGAACPRRGRGATGGRKETRRGGPLAGVAEGCPRGHAGRGAGRAVPGPGAGPRAVGELERPGRAPRIGRGARALVVLRAARFPARRGGGGRRRRMRP